MTDEEKVNEDGATEEAAEEPAAEVAEDAAKESSETAEEAAEVVEEPEVVDAPAKKVISGIEKVSAYMAKYLRDDLPDFKPGDTVKVHYKIIEGTKERIQVYEGVVISIKHGGLDKTFTVRKISWSVGVERTFFYNSRKIDQVQIVRRGRVRRAKIYYLRKRVGKAARIKELRRPKVKSKK